MAEKKTVLAVILGVSIVSLVSALVACLITGVTMLDYEKMYNVNAEIADYSYTAGVLLITALAIGIVFIALFVGIKKHRILVSIISASVVVLYFIITAIILKRTLHIYGYRVISGYNSTEYTMFTTYLTSVATLAVSVLLVTVSWILLDRSSKKLPMATNTDAQSTNEGVQVEPTQSE